MHADDALRQAIEGLALSTWSGFAYRGVNTRYLTSVNSVAGSLKASGRFHHKDDRLGVLYVGLTRGHVLSELEETAGTIFIPKVFEPPQYVVATFALDLTRVLDLRQVEVQRALGTSPQELSGAWALENFLYHQVAPTQRLARVAAERGVQALRYLSVKAPQLENLAVFVRNVESPVRASDDPFLPPQDVPDPQHTPGLTRDG